MKTIRPRITQRQAETIVDCLCIASNEALAGAHENRENADIYNGFMSEYYQYCALLRKFSK